MAPRTGTFTRADYERFTHPDNQRSGYGELEWFVEQGKFVALVTLDDSDGPTEVQVRINPKRPDEMTVLLRYRGVHLARIDVNGWHRFDDGMRRATHLQAQMHGSDSGETTLDISGGYPALAEGGYPDLDTQRWQCLRAAGDHLNIDFRGVQWCPVPDEGGAA